MEGEILFDLEEGEIPDYDLSSLRSPVKNDTDQDFRNECNLEKEPFNQMTLDKCRGISGYVNEGLRKRLKLGDSAMHFNKLRDKSQDDVMFDLISSDEDELSDADWSHLPNQRRCVKHVKRKIKHKMNYSRLTDGTVEDIMSQIDQVMCRKSNYRHRRCKAKDSKQSWEDLYESRKCSCRPIGTGVISEYKRLRKSKQHMECKFCLYDSMLCRKNRVRDDSYYRGHGSDERGKDGSSSSKEKLMRKDVKEISQGRGQSLGVMEHLEIGNDEMLHDSLNRGVAKHCVDENRGESILKCASETIETQCDDEMDLTQLRLIALASNKKKRNPGNQEENEFTDTEKSLDNTECGNPTSENSIESEQRKEVNVDADFDRNELLLRAEALKTALLKKHQKRLNRLKSVKYTQSGNSNDNATIPSSSNNSPPEKNKLDTTDGSTSEVKSVKQKCCLDQLMAENCLDKNVDEVNCISEVNEFKVGNPLKKIENDVSTPDAEPAQVIGGTSMKKIRNRSRKRKSIICNGNKEYGGNCDETAEEQCHNLRDQLLCDLVKRKATKTVVQNSVLMDSVQKSETNEVSQRQCGTVKGDATSQLASLSQGGTGHVAQLCKPPVPPRIPKPEMERIIVHLGSEDSSEDETSDNCSIVEKRTLPTLGDNFADSSELDNTDKQVSDTPNQTDESRLGCFEKKVMLLLGQTRRKIDQELQRAKDNKKMNDTPEAVYKHLPPSQRLEYIRLKQKIAEREREKRKPKPVDRILAGSPFGANEEALNSTGKSKAGNLDCTNSLPTKCGPLSSKTFNQPSNTLKAIDESKMPINTVGRGRTNVSTSKNPKKSDMKPAVEEKIIGSKNGMDSNSLLNLPNPVLISKLKFLLKKIKVEKTIEENYEKEITKLKSQLVLFEKKKSEQRFKIKRLAEESVKTYKLIQNDNVGTKKMYEVKAKPGKTVATSIRKDIPKENHPTKAEEAVEENPQAGISKVLFSAMSIYNFWLFTEPSEADARGTNDNVPFQEVIASSSMVPYNSPLEAFGQGSVRADRVDPNVIICQFDFTGKCRDKECVYQHLRAI
ncbi:hypothetical protein RUM43_000019 [Polyplax serrata]|uniref:Putative zinc-finger domain-containing protein n=1 Tax=Polyplax serrata TaxID=468196 RepID=A0AAN8SF96_POLSC